MKASSVCAGCLCVLIEGCIGKDCDYRLLRESQSPDANYIATVFESNCGATTPFVQHVLLRESTSVFDGGKTDNIVFTERGRPSVEVRWLDPAHIVIRRFPNRDNIFKELESWKGITISYVAD